MNYISSESISKAFEDKWLFKNITFGISKGQKIALIGINGSGKSTLLKVLAGVEPPDEGTIAVNKNITIGYLAQEPDFGSAIYVKDVLFSSENPVQKAIWEYEESLKKNNPDLLALAMENMDRLNAWEFEQKVQEIISRIGVPEPESAIAHLSGGQKKRIALARLLLTDSDLLILDEPTNHLDLDTIEWLQNLLSTQNSTLIMVTHDRYFLEAVTNEILELDQANLYSYQGSYSYFLEKKAERHAQFNTETEKAKNLMRKELDWVRRQPKARGTKAKYRLDAFEELKEKASQKQTAQALDLQVKASRQGNKVLEIEHLRKSFGSKNLIADFNYIFRKNEKIGIVGKNGTGKSTFLNLITGHLSPDTGEIIAGETTKFGYYRQEGLQYDPEQRVIDAVKDVAEVISLNDGSQVTASRFLEFFGFSPALQYSFISKLSGGERKRLQLLKVLISNPNFLILDEPSNDLDIYTLNVLEDFLSNFPGCLLIVSHDRYFLDQLADHLFIFEGNGKIRDFNGNYSDYRLWQQEEEEKIKESPKQKNSEQKTGNKTESTSASSKKLSFKEKKELEILEKEIPELESKKKNLIDQLNSGCSDHEKLTEWSLEIEALSTRIEQKTLRWLELLEIQES